MEKEASGWPGTEEAGRRRPPLRFRRAGHGADIALYVYGGDMDELFANGALALTALVVESRGEGRRFERPVSLGPEPDAFVPFLNEVLYLWETERFVTRRALLSAGREAVSGLLLGETFDEAIHRVLKEVKAVTYHGFSIEQRAGRLRARVIVDV